MWKNFALSRNNNQQHQPTTTTTTNNNNSEQQPTTTTTTSINCTLPPLIGRGSSSLLHRTTVPPAEQQRGSANGGTFSSPPSSTIDTGSLPRLCGTTTTTSVAIDGNSGGSGRSSNCWLFSHSRPVAAVRHNGGCCSKPWSYNGAPAAAASCSHRPLMGMRGYSDSGGGVVRGSVVRATREALALMTTMLMQQGRSGSANRTGRRGRRGQSCGRVEDEADAEAATVATTGSAHIRRAQGASVGVGRVRALRFEPPRGFYLTVFLLTECFTAERERGEGGDSTAQLRNILDHSLTIYTIYAIYTICTTRGAEGRPGRG